MANIEIKNDILSDLDQAQRILSRVYGYAQDIKDKNLESLMSVADGCIVETIDILGSTV